MKARSAEKVKLASFDDLFGTSREETAEQITSVPLALLRPFKDHTFRVINDEKMQEMVKSIRERGVQVPGIVRPCPDGGYEIVAGHRRWMASRLAGCEEMPVIIRNLNDDEATIAMVDTNIQREDILPSEKAKAYKMKYEALKHQGSKGDRHTADEVGENAGDSARTVQRYIRPTELIPELLEWVDIGKIPMIVGERISFLPENEQKWIMQAARDNRIIPSKRQAERIKEESEKGELTEAGIYTLLADKPESGIKVTIPFKQLRKYFPEEYTKAEIEEVIYSLLEEWKRSR